MAARKIMLIIISILAPLMLSSSLFLYEIDSTLINADFYLDSFDDVDVYERLPDIVGEQLAVTLDEDVEDLDKHEIKDVVNEVMYPEWVKDSMSSIIQGFFAYINNEKDELEGTVDVAILKSDIYDIVVRDHPDKDPDKILSEIPDNIELSEMIDAEDLDDARSLSSFIRSVKYLFYIILFSLLILVVVLAEGLSKKFRSIGIILLVPGIIITIVSYLSGRVIDSMTSDVGEGQLFIDVINSISDNFTGQVMLHGVMFILLGLILILLSIFYFRK